MLLPKIPNFPFFPLSYLLWGWNISSPSPTNLEWAAGIPCPMATAFAGFALATGPEMFSASHPPKLKSNFFDGLVWIPRFQHYSVNISGLENWIEFLFAVLKPCLQSSYFADNKPHMCWNLIFYQKEELRLFQGVPPKLKSNCHNPTNDPKQLKTTFVGVVL